jgi:cytochrome c oxidase cbb3-type subunit IV
MMDYGTLRGVFTLLIFALFIVIVIWSYSKKRKTSFDNIANSILDDDLSPINNKKQNKQETNNNV